jgi:hypothetical protein
MYDEKDEKKARVEEYDEDHELRLEVARLIADHEYERAGRLQRFGWTHKPDRSIRIRK